MTQQPARFDVIDSAKGVGIILVVFGHAWRGAQGAGLIPQHATALGRQIDLFGTIDAMIYAFHMPLFFFLSGLLFLETLQKYQTSTLVRGRLTRLLWPMALWTWLFFGVKLLAGDGANAPVAAADFPLVPLPPYEHLWFLWALFVIQGVLVLAYAVGGGVFRNQALRWGAAGLALAWAFALPFMSVPSQLWGPVVAHVPYFLAGITAGAFLGWRPHIAVQGLVAAGFIILLWQVGGSKAAPVHSLALVVLGWIFLLGSALNSRLFVMLGQGSMAIYLTHTIFSAALRIVMVKSGFDGLLVVLVATVLIGLTAPLGVLWAARKSGTTKLLGF